MADLPLLVFPRPTRSERAKLGGGGGKLTRPEHGAQAARLTPQFARLQQALDDQRLALQGNPFGIEPEQVLVLETVGDVSNFLNAVKKVEGLEWMGEMELEDVPPAHGFHDIKKPEKDLKGHIFLVMTDQRAMQELQNLFSQWQQNENVDFARGLAPLKHAFNHLSAIRPWAAEDRVRETGLREDWRERAAGGQSIIPFEIELWHRDRPERRQQAEAYLRQTVADLGGSITQRCEIDEISYHALLGSIPTAAAQDFIEDTTDRLNFGLLRCEDVMYLRPVGQCLTALPIEDEQTETAPAAAGGEPLADQPLIALLDGLPLTGHHLVDGRIIVDDPDGWETGYQVAWRRHGTAMASLICHGDPAAGQEPLARKVYARPILKPLASHQDREHIPDDVLPVDLIHSAVRRLFEPEGDQPPVAPTVRIINLSIGDPRHPFDATMSAWARLLDWLAWKYQVLFIVSAGNHDHPLTIPMDRTTFAALEPAAREMAAINALAADTRLRRLLSPSETVNGLTIGATHQDASTTPEYLGSTPHDPLPGQGRAAVYSAHGLGFNRTIKPDILFPGGRMFMGDGFGAEAGTTVLATHAYTRPPGQQHAAPGTSGQLDKLIHSRGTSNATALASRAADQIYSMLQELRRQPGVALPETHDAVLLKALLAHGASWGDAGNAFRAALLPGSDANKVKLQIARHLGYGQSDVERVLRCTEQRATVLGIGALDDGEADVYRLPMPPSLSTKRVRRRLTITLAWITPIKADVQKYRLAHLWIAGKPRLASKRQESDNDAVQRGTLQHEIFEDRKVLDFVDGDAMEIKVNCRKLVADADLPQPVPYALAVTAEETEGLGLPIYNEIKERIGIRVRADGEGEA